MLQNKKNGYVHINLGGKLKAESSAVLKEMDLTLSEAVRIFLRRVVQDRAIPFDVRYSTNLPNSATCAAVSDGESNKATKNKNVILKKDV